MSGVEVSLPEVDMAQEIKRLALQLASVVDALERRSEMAVGAIDTSHAAIARAAAELGQRGRQLVNEIGRHAQAESRSAAEQAFAPLAHALSTQMEAAAAKAQRSADALQQARVAMVSAQRRAFWMGSVALGLGALAVAGASTWWVLQQRDALRDVEFAAAIHEASQRGTLVPCGDALCVRVGERPRKIGERGEFLVVD